MKRIYDKEVIDEAIKHSIYREVVSGNLKPSNLGS